MFHVTVGPEGLVNSWQDPFPSFTECWGCGARADIGFVANEIPDRDGPPVEQQFFVCRLHANDPVVGNGVWLHDCVAVAVYFCRSCLTPTALYNQA